MKRYSASQARQHLSDLLDAAERGEAVVIERGERRFVVKTERRARPKKVPPSRVEWMDPAVEAGQWTWQTGPRGLEFAPRPPKKPR